MAYSTGTLTIRGGLDTVYGSSDADFVAGEVQAGDALVVWGVPQPFTIKSVVNKRTLQLTEAMPGALDVSEVAYAINGDFTPILGMPIFVKDSINTQLHAERFLKTLDDELPIVPPDYTARWLFNGDGLDASSRRLNALESNVTYEAGVRDECVRFTRALSPYLRVSDATVLRPTTLSFAVWLNPTSYTAGQAVFIKSSTEAWTNGYGLVFPLTSIGATRLAFFINDSTLAANRAVVDVPLGGWTHVAGVFTGAQIRLYKNGALASAINYATALTNPLSTFFWIGQGPGVQRVNQAWDGRMDDLIFYNRALSAGEVANIYASYSR